MTRHFGAATAEQMVSAVDAVLVRNGSADLSFVAKFIDSPESQARSALELAADLGLVNESNGVYEAASPMSRFLATADQGKRASIVRLLLESYDAFTMFRSRLVVTQSLATAAEQTKTALGLDAHREEIKDTLVSLGTYAYALTSEGGGHYLPVEAALDDVTRNVAEAASDAASAEATVRTLIGADAAQQVSRVDVIIPLADALQRARIPDSMGAVTAAGNAVESCLSELGNRTSVNLAGKHGITAKAIELKNQGIIPGKMLDVAKYLGSVRNAADHGTDPDVGKAWSVSESTGSVYPLVACAFIQSVHHWELSSDATL